MNIFTKIGAGLLIVAVQAMAVVLAQGSIKLYQKGSIEDPGDTCVIAIPASYRDYDMAYHGCNNDVYSFFTLDNVESAVRIAFASERDCRSIGPNYTGDWYYMVKTYIDPTGTSLISLPGVVASAIPGQLLKPGLMFVEGKNKNNKPVEGKLSCLYIWPGTPAS